MLAVADTTPPLITNVLTANITQAGVTITWDTDEPATSHVEYGITVIYGGQTTEDSGLATSHSVTITGLTANTQYYFRVVSKDASNNSAAGADSTFTTLPTPNTQPSSVYPNPFSLSNGQVVQFKVQNLEPAIVKIYTMSENLVRSLTGTTTISWDGINEGGEKVTRGVYLYKITKSNGDVITGKLAITK